MNISCSSTEDYDNADFTSNVSSSIGSGDSPFIIVGEGGTILKSVDGINWQNNSIITSGNFNNVSYGNYTFLISGSQVNDKNISFTSRNGSDWIDVAFDFGYGSTGKSTYGLEKFVVTANNKVYYATLGSNWFSSSVGEGGEIGSIIFADGIFYITQGTHIKMSENLTSWANPVAAGDWKDITVGNDLVVAVGSDGSNEIITYFQFGSWQSAVVPNVDSSLKSIAFGNDVFVAVESSYHTTTDLSSWTKISTTGSFNKIKVRKGIFVAVGDNGVIQTSSDGKNWSSRASGTSYNLRDVY